MVLPILHFRNNVFVIFPDRFRPSTKTVSYGQRILSLVSGAAGFELVGFRCRAGKDLALTASNYRNSFKLDEEWQDAVALS